jgi:hypothetical protein
LKLLSYCVKPWFAETFSEARAGIRTRVEGSTVP